MGFGNGRLQSFEMIPPPKPRKNRVPLTDDHKIGVLDPLSAVLVPAQARKARGGVRSERPRSWTDGPASTSFSPMPARRPSRAARNPIPAPAVVCSMRYRAVAGHKNDKEDIAALEAERDMRVWMAPVGDSGVMIPVKLHIRTKKAPLTLTADRFAIN